MVGERLTEETVQKFIGLADIANAVRSTESGRFMRALAADWLRLRKAIQDAPHDGLCPARYPSAEKAGVLLYGGCTCWKSRALEVPHA